MINLDICWYYFFCRPLLIDVVFPYWTLNVFGIFWNVGLVVGILCSFTPHGDLHHQFWYSSSLQSVFTSLSIFSLSRLHKGDRFKLVESQGLKIFYWHFWNIANNKPAPELAAWEWHRVLDRVTVWQTVATLGRLVYGADLLQELLGPPGVTAGQGAVGPGQTCNWCLTMLRKFNTWSLMLVCLHDLCSWAI